VDDAELLHRTAQGDLQAFEELYRRYSGSVYALLLHILGIREEAEEILQDTFVKLHREAHRYQPERGSVATFLFVIARTLAFSRLRARQARPQKDEAWDVHDPTQELGLWEEAPEERILIRLALQRLPQDERELLEAAFYRGYSHSELAKRFGLPLGTVKTKLRRALQQLRGFLEEA
jgi:RNA polymerase sigma-70 factor (ECF subfamily)